MIQIPNRKILYAILIALGMFSAVSTARAADISVNTAQDDNQSNPNVCSLREAILAANTNAAVNGCAAGSAAQADFIRFDANIMTFPATLTLGSALPTIIPQTATDSLTIEGPGAASFTIQGNGNRIFDIAVNANVDISGLTLTGGNIAIRITDGNVALTNMALNGNSADDGAAVYNNRGKISIRNSTLSGNRATNGNAGAVYNYQNTVSIVDSTLSDNTAADHGGAVYSEEGRVTVLRSLFSGNTASARSSGGGIDSYRGRITVTDSTFSQNSAGRGGAISAYLAPDNIALTNATFFNNTAATNGAVLLNNGSPVLFTNSTVFDSLNAAPFLIETVDTGTTPSITFRNTLVAGGAAGCSGAIFSLGNNLDQGASCGFTQAGDLSSTPAQLATTPQVQGGTTPTLTLSAGSPALNAGDCAAGPANDQRGFARPQNADCDMGAVEILCGNSVVEASETCDDGNTTGGDGCSDSCQTESNPNPTPNPTPTPTPTPAGSSGGGCSLQMPRR